MSDVRSLLKIPADSRADALERWFAAQPDAASAARALAQSLAALEAVPHRAEGSNTDTALLYFLEAERIRFPLDEAAEAADDPEIAAQLWGHASTSALILGELADLPYTYAKKAILTGTRDALVWSAFQDSLYGDTTGFFEDIEGWQKQVAAGTLAPEVVTRAIAAARHCAPNWSAEDRELLAMIE